MDDYKRLELITRFVIFLPLIVIVIFFLRSHKASNSTSQNKKPTVTLAQSQQQQKSASQSNSTSMSFDLTGPYRCLYTNEDTTVDISIQNRKVAVIYTVGEEINHVLVNGDCGYIWKDGEAVGEKMCNIGQYLSMVDMLSSFNMLDLDSMLSMVQRVDPSLSVSDEFSQNVMDTCVKEKIDATAFTVPTNITFNEMQSISPSIPTQ